VIFLLRLVKVRYKAVNFYHKFVDGLIKNGEFEGLIKSCGLCRQDAYFLAKKWRFFSARFQHG